MPDTLTVLRYSWQASVLQTLSLRVNRIHSSDVMETKLCNCRSIETNREIRLTGFSDRMRVQGSFPI
jgi:hypothetical protein